MPIFSKEGSRLLFVHVPKTAGSAIEDHFTELGWTVDYLDRSNPSHCDSLNSCRRVSPQHMHNQLLKETFDLSRFDLIFTVIRNPIERLKSEFAWRNRDLLGGEVTYKLVENWWLHHKKAFRKDPFHLDNHFRPQTDFILPMAKVFRFETDLDSVASLALGLGSSDRIEGDQLRSLRRVNMSWSRSQDIPISSRLSRDLTRFYKDDFRYLKTLPDKSSEPHINHMS